MTIPSTQEITVVLGSGRSGTSVITKALQTLGCSLGDNLTPASQMNPKGFFEDNQIVYEINEKIIARLGHAWHDLMPFDLSLSFSDLSDKAENILTEKFKTASWCGFKDPRTSKLLPFWQPVFKKMNLKESYILALRNPLSSVASFEKYDQIHRSKGFLVWLTYVISAVENTLDKNMLIVSYEEMLTHPKQQLERIHSSLNFSTTLEATAMEEYQSGFLDTTLSRNQYSYEEFKDSTAPTLCIKLYDLLNSVAVDKLSFTSHEFKLQWSKIFSSYYNFLDNFLSICAELDTISHLEKKILEQEQKILEKENLIHSLLSSRSWRFTVPLRKISSYLGLERSHPL